MLIIFPASLDTFVLSPDVVLPSPTPLAVPESGRSALPGES